MKYYPDAVGGFLSSMPITLNPLQCLPEFLHLLLGLFKGFFVLDDKISVSQFFVDRQLGVEDAARRLLADPIPKVAEDFKLYLPPLTTERLEDASVSLVETKESRSILDGALLYLGEILERVDTLH